MKKLILFILTLCYLHATPFSVATYNVENLFDLNYDQTEYKEYIPKKGQWDTQIQETKLNNLAQVLNEMNADIVALQEIESQAALDALLQKVPQYQYHHFLKNSKTAVGTAFISKYKLLNPKRVYVTSKSKTIRHIQKVIVLIENKKFHLFNNHWSSKRQPESARIEYALALKKYIDALAHDIDYILLGDFNSNYNEYLSLKQDKKLNDSLGITGINQILNTTLDNEFVLKKNILNHTQKVHYNLWLDLPYNERFSYIYKGHNQTPDNILLSASLFDNQNISYLEESFQVFKPDYLYQNRNIKRWNKNRGYSDHLPIMASFDTKPYVPTKDTLPDYTTGYLYKTKRLDKPLTLKEVMVIYKHDNSAILKQKKSRAIYAFNNAKELNLGEVYDLEVEQIQNYFGLKEIKNFTIVAHKVNTINPSSFYKEANSIDLFDLEQQNEIITNLTGVFKNGYVYFDDKKIKLYAKDKTLLPNNGQNITIMSGHLGYYKSHVQIIIYQKSDFRVN
ncbi:endonuclease/exonuclease/phosphatase family protein [Candidatus Marinarcus aquaticus]|uniref:Endonuclease n=1 Tax=Candidatus Marinarcus aquaticus TaxID=2044504 RepID=A0A4V1LP51_9BACT|nr:endonuclease/exonuclease/phosphatase family protein [Candidatus Marinarcus aquaticus]RXJ59978.1 endonuclease [Candidatus Marinarcus aquaticus]